MRKNARLFRLTTPVALTALLCNAALPIVATAQPAAPPLPQPGATRPDLSQGDPPERVGRLASMTGTVSFHNLGDTQWSAASPNYPVSNGNSFWTEPSSQAQLEISDSRIAMAPSTEFDVATLDASGLQGVAAQGEVYLRLRDLAPNEAWSIQTPRGLVSLNGQGRYAISVGATDQPTLVTVVEGSARIDGPGVSLQVQANQTATITGTDSFQGSVGPILRDDFLTAQLNAERPRPAPAVPLPAAVAAMPGGSDLVGSGSWSQAPEYGQVWYPPVPATWVPYREGHWAYVAPWGWTWVDDAPWGFAPFHYGRWVQIGGRWGWTPGAETVAAPPVYAPALVTFVGIGVGVAIGAALASGSIGWVPLGPREPYHPWYRASNTYIRQVNVAHVTNITNNNITINNYINRGAATSIPAAAMVGSRPVQGLARPISPQEFAAARPIAGRQPIPPTAATAGVTPVVARQLNLPAAAAAHPAPGPEVHPPNGRAGAFARPAFAPGAAVPPQSPNHPPGSPPVAPGNRPPGAPGPEAGRPGSEIGAHPEPPGTAHPGATPAAARPLPENTPGGPHAGPQTEAHPGPGAAAERPGSPAAPHPGAPEGQPPSASGAGPHAAPPVAHLEAPNGASSAAHAEPPHPVPPAAHVEPPHPAPPAAHAEPPHPAPPVAHVEPPHPVARVEPPRPPPAVHAEIPHPIPAAAPRPAPPPPHAAPPHPEPEERKKQPE